MICVAVDFSLICVTSNGVSINFCQVIYAPANVAAILNSAHLISYIDQINAVYTVDFMITLTFPLSNYVP